ncbi:hypothetical protein JCM11491_006687 [Sporobolomyces phaffii]
MQRRLSDSSSSPNDSDDASSSSIASRVDSSSESLRSLDHDSDYSDDDNEAASTEEAENRWCSLPVVIGLAVTLVVAMITLAVWMRGRGDSATGDDLGVTRATSAPSTVDQIKLSDVLATSTPTPSSNDSKLGNATSQNGTSSDTSCFPLNPSPFPSSGAPTQSRKDWWCEDRELYGFLGFSYPLEVVDCADASNGFEQIDKDLKRMKSEFGSTMVRPYAVSCREVSVWENLVKACVQNEMGLIVQIWWGFAEDQTLWEKTEASIVELFESSSLAGIAPYVIHSASFGSEPIGDGVLGSNFVSSLAKFRSKMNGFGVPVGISEDWDRGQLNSGGKIAGLGAEISKNTDVAHLHVMPYYHPDSAPLASDAWPARTNLDRPTIITQSMWSSKSGGTHGRGGHDDQANQDGFKTYWEAFSSNCAFFKEHRVGWFVHVFDDSQEPYFGMVRSDGATKIKGWKPERC